MFHLFLIVLFFSGCATIQNPHHQTIAQQAFVWLNQTAAVDIQEVLAKENEVYIKYQAYLKDSSQSRIFYAKANWDPSKSKVIDLTKNIVVPLEFMEEDRWSSVREGADPVRALSSDYWDEFRFYFTKELTPQGKNKGAVFINDQLELIAYYDDHKELKIVEIKNKPTDVEVVRSYTQEQLTEIIVLSLMEFLKPMNIEEDRLLLSMAHQSDPDQTFLYVDLAERIAVSLKVEDASLEKYRQKHLRKGIKSVDLLILDSHVFGLATRPFSSAFRLFAWTKDSTLNMLQPHRLSYLKEMVSDIPIPPLYEGKGMDLDEFEKKLDKVVGKNLSLGTVSFLIGGDEYFPRQIEAFQNAKDSIHLRIFIFDNDDYAVKIADILKEKSREKEVDVKVLLDGMGVVMGEGKISETLPAGFVPPSSMVKYLQEDSDIAVRVRPNAWFKADHTKTITIDEEISFTGGMNFGREYRYDWNDMMMEVRGPIVAEILHEFDMAWEHAGKLGDVAYIKAMINKSDPKREGKGYPIRPLYTRANDPQIFKAQVEAIKRAKRYIYISNAYFSDNVILNEIIDARRRGVDVRVILPYHGNHEIMNKSNVVTANIMFKNGIRVFFYPGMSHIKAAIYDGWLCTGSANFDKLSFKDNLEFNLATSYSPVVEELLNKLFKPDFSKSKEMKEPLASNLRNVLAEFLAEQL